MKGFKRTVRRFVLLALTIGACGCLTVGGASAAGKLAKVSVGMSITDSTFLPIYLAEQQGYFKQEGLDATFSTFHGGSDLVRGVVSNSVDIGMSSPAGVISAIKAGQDLKVFFGGFNQTPFSLCSIPSVKTLAQAKGKRFGVSRYGSSTDELTRYMLKAHHINPKTDVRIIQGGGSASRLAAMEAGQLDVALFSVPFDLIAAEKGYNVLLRQSDVMPDYPIQSFFARESYIKSHPKIIKALLRGFIRGVRLAKSNKALAVETLVKTVSIKKQYAEKAYGDLAKGWREDGRLASKAGMKAFFDMAMASGHVKSVWPKDKYWDNEFVSTIGQWGPK